MKIDSTPDGEPELFIKRRVKSIEREIACYIIVYYSEQLYVNSRKQKHVVNCYSKR